MKVFKFGGASIKDAEAVKNLAKILGHYAGDQLLIVVSAMGKNTNLLERIVRYRWEQKEYQSALAELHDFHFAMVSNLFRDRDNVLPALKDLLAELEELLSQTREFDALYDAVVVYGELLSSTILSAYLNDQGLANQWLDTRELIETDDHHRRANVDWEQTCKQINDRVPVILEDRMVVSQGFIASTSDNKSTTLGREGSDFTAAIFASCLEAESVTVWKDVPGILNGDPKIIKNTKKFEELPYKEAAEMTYYGASVIHPKTIRPLANKKIPLHVRSFYDYKAAGTVIHSCSFQNPMPTFMVKDNQCLISFKVTDYSFVNEHNLSVIFRALAQADVPINIMQNSAVSFSIVVDDDLGKVEGLIEDLKKDFQIRYNTGLQLITIKNYTQDLLDQYRSGRKILLEQLSRNNYRALVNSH